MTCSFEASCFVFSLSFLSSSPPPPSSFSSFSFSRGTCVMELGSVGYLSILCPEPCLGVGLVPSTLGWTLLPRVLCLFATEGLGL